MVCTKSTPSSVPLQSVFVFPLVSGSTLHSMFPRLNQSRPALGALLLSPLQPKGMLMGTLLMLTEGSWTPISGVVASITSSTGRTTVRRSACGSPVLLFWVKLSYLIITLKGVGVRRLGLLSVCSLHLFSASTRGSPRAALEVEPAKFLTHLCCIKPHQTEVKRRRLPVLRCLSVVPTWYFFRTFSVTYLDKSVVLCF